MKLRGLIAATYTPLHEDGSLNLDLIPMLTEHLLHSGVAGLYVCGSTGEGVSLTSRERQQVAAAYVQAAGHRAPVIVQVGHNSLSESRELADQAGGAGADAISASPPSYFKFKDPSALIDSMAEIAAATPHLPFYYYHIPSMTGVAVDMPMFLEQAAQAIPNWAGAKYTDNRLDEYQFCLKMNHQRHDVLWGLDEMLLAALAVGGQAAVGSTYNIAAPLYNRIIRHVRDGELESARCCQLQAVKMIRTIAKHPFHPAVKAILSMQGLPCGPCRLPQTPIGPNQINHLRSELEELGYFEWARAGTD